MSDQVKENQTKEPMSLGELLFWGLVGTVAVGAGIKAFKGHRRSLDVRHGFDQEVTIANKLERKGADVTLSPGSRGPFDMHVDWGSEQWLVQSKASRRGTAKPPSQKKTKQLITTARKLGAEPVIALSDGGKTTFYDATSFIKPKKKT
jgi:Holliday junction resolvase